MKKGILILLLLITVILLGIAAYIHFTNDRKAPEITFQEKDIVYNENEDQDILLQDVTAYDDVDGDVTNSIMIESVIPISGNESKARVIYVAKDSSNNVTKKSRIVILQ